MRNNSRGSSSSRRSTPLQKLAVSFSFVLVIVIASSITTSSAGTIQNRNTIATPVSVGSVNPNSGSKTPGRRVMHAAFENAGKNPGLEIWRIENFEPVRVPDRDHGRFYSGDSYIILNTQKNRNNQFTWDVHFWLGSETSTDEAGAAAILTVQLDDLLNGAPVQHREVQDHESSLFLGYFRNGIRYEKGGVGTGFSHVEPNSPGEKRLFQVKGKRNVRVRQVNLSISSMNKGDCFILDAGNDVYIYVGTGAKRVEKLKAISAANQIRDQDHNGRAKVQIIDEYSTDVDKQQFFTVLGSGSPSEVPEESTAEEDETFERNDERTVTLYKVSDAVGGLKIDPISTKPLRQEMLDTNDCFILDTGSAIFVWVGRKATQQEKSQSMAKAQEFIQTKKYPAWTQVRRIVEGAESAPFKQYFATWRDANMAHTRLVRAVDNTEFGDEPVDESYIQALKKSGGKALGFMPDNGNGEIFEVWNIKDSVVELVDPADYGQFYGGDSIVVKYMYDNENGDKAVVAYCWLGQDSSDEDKALAELKASTPGENETTAVAHVLARITQGHEPRHFRKIFKGQLFTHFSSDKNRLAIYRVRGVSDDDVIAEELKFDPSKLCSDDAFIITTSQGAYIWNGKGATESEKKWANTVGNVLAESIETIDEGSESEKFWEDLGGKPDYDKTIGAPGAPILEPRLFHVKILSNGRFKFEEIENFSQEDMDIDDVMILDGGDEVYAWIGSGTSDEEKTNSFNMAKQYVTKDPTERTADTVPLIKLWQGQEPGCFRRIFPGWNDELWESMPSYEDIKKEIADTNELLNDI